MEREIIIKNDLSEIIRISLFTKEVGMTLQLPSNLNMRIGVAVEEAISSIIRHAYLPGKVGEITLKASFVHGDVTFMIVDDGVSFDPTLNQKDSTIPTIKQILAEGPGFFYISRTMDEITYHTVHSQNYLMLTKKVDSSEDVTGSMLTNICKIGDTLVLTVEGRLDTANARTFETVVQPLLARPEPNVIINCEELTFISSSGLRSFILLQKHITSGNRQLMIKSMRPEIRKIFSMTGCESLFDIR